jgi:hypothetical protein
VCWRRGPTGCCILAGSFRHSSRGPLKNHRQVGGADPLGEPFPSFRGWPATIEGLAGHPIPLPSLLISAAPEPTCPMQTVSSLQVRCLSGTGSDRPQAPADMVSSEPLHRDRESCYGHHSGHDHQQIECEKQPDS